MFDVVAGSRERAASRGSSSCSCQLVAVVHQLAKSAPGGLCLTGWRTRPACRHKLWPAGAGCSISVARVCFRFTARVQKPPGDAWQRTRGFRTHKHTRNWTRLPSGTVELPRGRAATLRLELTLTCRTACHGRRQAGRWRLAILLPCALYAAQTKQARL